MMTKRVCSSRTAVRAWRRCNVRCGGHDLGVYIILGGMITSVVWQVQVRRMRRGKSGLARDGRRVFLYKDRFVENFRYFLT